MALYNRCELCKITPYDLKQFSVSLQTCDVSVALIGDVINPVVDDTALTSSSIFSAITPARLSRLNTSAENGYAGAWSARFANTAQWIKVDLGGVKTVQQVITQGRQDFNQWVREYRVSYSLDDVTFVRARSTSGHVRLFGGNRDRSTRVTSTFDAPLVARYVRLHPVRWGGWISLRWELSGCAYGKRVAYRSGHHIEESCRP